MALFRFGRPVSIRWNGLLIEGVAGTIFEVPDEYRDELQAAMRVEPTFEWIDSDEAATLRARVTALEASSGSGVTLSNINPLALGAVSPGTGTAASRNDHIHPSSGFVTLTGTETLTNKTLTGPVIDSPKIGYTTQAITASPVTLTSSSNYYQFITGSGSGLSFRLPLPSTMVIGQGFEFNNNANNTVSVQINAGGTTVATVGAGVSRRFLVTSISSGDVASAWDVEMVGASSLTGSGSIVLSSAPTMDNVGISYATLNGSLRYANWTSTTSSGGTTALTTSGNLLQKITGTSSHTITFPSAGVAGLTYIIYNTSTGTVTVNASAGGLVWSLPSGRAIQAYLNTSSGTTPAAWDVFEVNGLTSSLTAHTSAADPHSQYLTQVEADAIYSALSHTHTGIAASYTSVIKQYVKNTSGSTINKGQAVYVNGSTGTNVTVSKADYDSDLTSSKTLGLMENTVANNGFDWVITEGVLTGFDTTAASTEGVPVWLGASGNLIYGTAPSEPNHAVYIGVVTKRNVSNGEVFIKVQNGYELTELHNVDADSPSDNDVIQFDSASGYWKNESLATAGISSTSHNHSGVYDPAGTASSAVTTHAAVTTSVHGITDTANLVYTSDSRLSDSRTPISHTHAEADVTSLVTDLAGKASSVHTHAESDVTSLTTDLGLKAPLASPTFTGTVTLPSTTSIGTVSSTEIGYVDGVTSAIQTQINAKAATSHVHATSDVTTGNYVATLTAGTGVTLTNNSGNAASPTVAIGQAVETTSNVTFNQVTITAANSTYASRATVASSAQTFTTGTEATVALDTASGSTGYASYDPKSWFNNAGDYIAPTVAGFYIVTGCVVFVANASGYRELNLQVDYAANGTWVDITSQRVAPNASQQGRLNVSTVVYLQANARLRMRATQNSGGNLDTVVVSGSYPVLSVARVGA